MPSIFGMNAQVSLRTPQFRWEFIVEPLSNPLNPRTVNPFQAWLPRHCLDDNPEHARVAKLLFFYAVIGLIVGSFYVLVYCLLALYFSAASIAIAVVGGVAALYQLYRGERLAVAGHIIALCAFAAVAGIIPETGMIHSPTFGWLFAAPMMAASTLGFRAGLFWLLTVLCYIATIFFVGASLSEPLHTVSSDVRELFVAVVHGGLILTIFATAWSFSNAQTSAFKALHQARRIAEDALLDAEQTHNDAILVLNNISEGLVMITLEGKVAGDPSKQFQEWFGTPQKGQAIWEHMEPQNPLLAGLLELNWEQLLCDWMPLDLGIDQLPKRFDHQGRTFSLRYQPVVQASHEPSQLLMICTDITAELEAEHSNDLQKEQMAIFSRFAKDPRSVRGFLEESQRLVSLVDNGKGTFAEQKRWIHTLKGNFGIFGLTSFARWLHQLEDELDEQCDVCDLSQRQAIASQWESVRERLSMIIPEESKERVTIDRSRIESTLLTARQERSITTLIDEIQRWTWDDVRQRFDLLAERAKALGERLEKPGMTVLIDCDRVRTPPTTEWNSFWNALTHVVRNAVDHGIEPAEVRLNSGKHATGVLQFNAFENPKNLVIEICDDGGGVDWKRVATKAMKLGLRTSMGEQLQDLLFADGLSTKATVCDTSGRGVGMSAAKEACLALDGKIEVDSSEGRGTTFRFVFPIESISPTEVIGSPTEVSESSQST